MKKSLMAAVMVLFLAGPLTAPALGIEFVAGMVYRAADGCKIYLERSMEEEFPYRGLDSAHSMVLECSQEEVVQYLLPREKEHLERLRQKIDDLKPSLSEPQLRRMASEEDSTNHGWKAMRQVIMEQDPDRTSEHWETIGLALMTRSLSEEDLQEFTNRLENKFAEMRKALYDGDIDRAMTYVHPRTRPHYEQMFSAFPLEVRKKAASEEYELVFDSRDTGRVLFEIHVTRDGLQLSFPLEFAPHGGKWKVLRY